MCPPIELPPIASAKRIVLTAPAPRKKVIRDTLAAIANPALEHEGRTMQREMRDIHRKYEEATDPDAKKNFRTTLERRLETYDSWNTAQDKTENAAEVKRKINTKTVEKKPNLRF